jgi:hypothetical protein
LKRAQVPHPLVGGRFDHVGIVFTRIMHGLPNEIASASI